MESMRVLIGCLLEKLFNHREDRGLNKKASGEFESYEEMGLWIRRGMTHEQYDEFIEDCRENAAERYSNYLALFRMLGINLQADDRLSRYYFYTEYYKRLLIGS